MKKYASVIIIGIILLFGLYQCPVYQLIGLPCPACGMTRAYRLLLCGDIKGAFFMHPLFFVPALLLLKKCRKKWVIVLFAVVFLAVYVVRMYLYFPTVPPMNYNYNSMLGEFFK